MFTRSGISAALLFTLLAPAAVSAQTSAVDRPGPVFFASGGGSSALTDLNDAGTASLNTGWSAGGGVGWQFNPYVAVRGTFDFARARSFFSMAVSSAPSEGCATPVEEKTRGALSRQTAT